MKAVYHPIALLVVLLLGTSPTVSAEDWPCFRGPTRQGISHGSDVPLRWSLRANLAWKTPIPGWGWSSPIVYQDRVYVTTAADEGSSLHLLCLDGKTGGIV